ncbi:hypothetical protein ACTFIW_000279 [Dictyostelium discoideum]
MGHNYHHHHHHHKRHSCSNCCIGINTIFFLITFIAGAVITAAIFVPSVEYKDGWLKISASLVEKPTISAYCSNETCSEYTNQVEFPYYFYDHGRTFPYEYDNGDTPLAHKNSTEPSNECTTTSSTYQCYNTSVTFNYHINSTFTNTDTLYVQGNWEEAYDFNAYITNATFPCWVSTSNSSKVSIVPIPRYSPGAAIAISVLFSFALLSLLLILVLISIRCFCKQVHFGYNKGDYQPISSF